MSNNKQCHGVLDVFSLCNKHASVTHLASNHALSLLSLCITQCLQDFIFSVIFVIGHLAGGVVTAVFAADWGTTDFDRVTAAMAVASVS